MRSLKRADFQSPGKGNLMTGTTGKIAKAANKVPLVSFSAPNISHFLPQSPRSPEVRTESEKC